MTSQPVSHDERLPGVKRFSVGFEAALKIVRMHALGPAISHFLLNRAAGKLEPGLVEESAEFVQARHPDKDGRRVSYHAETLFALAQLSLTFCALLDDCREKHQRHGQDNEEHLDRECVLFC